MTSIAVSSVVPVAGFEQEVHPSANAIATSYPWFDEIEKTIIQSVVSTFGLDFLLFQDKLGGNVDTIHNVRKGIYASEAEETRYRIRQDYDSDEYHNHDDYIKAGKRNNQLQQEGCLHDAYRNSTMFCGEKYDRDHVISAKEIHDDPGRILAEQSGAELANQESNLQATLSTINKSKKESSLDEYVKKLPRLIDEHKKTVARHERRLQALLSDPYNNRGQIQKLKDKIKKTKEKVRALESVDKDAMLERDRKARSAYEEKINRAYYGGSKFLKKTAIASATAAIAMGARQVLGLVCAEIWFELRDGIPSIFRKSKNELGLNDLFMHFKTMLQRIWERIKLRFHDFLTTFKEGAIGGALSSVTTTIFNIFTTTAKGAIKIIREAWLYLTKALKLVLFNPENLDLIDLGKAVTGVLAAGASALAGSFIYAELVNHDEIGAHHALHLPRGADDDLADRLLRGRQHIAQHRAVDLQAVFKRARPLHLHSGTDDAAHGGMFFLIEHTVCLLRNGMGQKKNRAPLTGRHGLLVAQKVRKPDQRLLNCLRRRAECRPTFLRSTSRASRVT